MTIDWTVSIGNLLTIGGVLSLFVGSYFVIRNEVAKLQWDGSSISNRLGNIETEMRSLSQVLIKMAVQDERLVGHGQRINKLEESVKTLERGHV